MLSKISPLRWAAIVAISTTSIVLNAMPAMIAVLGPALHWNEVQLGNFASADVVGYTCGALLSTGVMRWRSPKVAALAGVVALLLADLGSATATSATVVLLLRGLGGAGAGLASGAASYVMSLSHQAENAGLSTAGQTGLGFVGIVAVPWLAQAAGWRLVFVVLAALAVPALWVVRRFPPDRWASTADVAASERPGGARRMAPWVATAGVAAYFLGQGALWTYLGLVAAAAHLSQWATDASLDACAAGLFLGSMLVLVVRAHVPRRLILGLCSGLTGIAIVGLNSDVAAVFIPCAAVFGLLYPIFPAFQFEVIARASTAAAVISLTASMAGYSCGPLIASRLIGRFGYSSLHWLAAAGCAVALLTLVPLLGRSAAGRAVASE